jgi:hypothetical protein
MAGEENVQIAASEIEEAWRVVASMDPGRATVTEKREFEKLRSDVLRFKRDTDAAANTARAEAVEILQRDHGSLEGLSAAQYRSAVNEAVKALPPYQREAARSRAYTNLPDEIQVSVDIERQARMQGAVEAERLKTRKEFTDTLQAEAEEESFQLNRESYNAGSSAAMEIPDGVESLEQLQTEHPEIYKEYKRKELAGELPTMAGDDGAVGTQPTTRAGTRTVSVNGTEVAESVFAEAPVTLRAVKGLPELDALEPPANPTDGIAVSVENRIVTRTPIEMRNNPELGLVGAMEKTAREAGIKAGYTGADLDEFIRVNVIAARPRVKEAVAKDNEKVQESVGTAQAEQLKVAFPNNETINDATEGARLSVSLTLDSSGSITEARQKAQEEAIAIAASTLGIEPKALVLTAETRGYVSRIANNILAEPLQEYEERVLKEEIELTQLHNNLVNQHGYAPERAKTVVENRKNTGYAAFNSADAEARRDADVLLEDKTAPLALRQEVQEIIDDTLSKNGDGTLDGLSQALKQANWQNFESPRNSDILEAAGHKEIAVADRMAFKKQPATTASGAVNPIYAYYKMSPEEFASFLSTDGNTRNYEIGPGGVPVFRSASGVPQQDLRNRKMQNVLSDGLRAMAMRDPESGKLLTMDKITEDMEVLTYQVKPGVFYPRSGSLKRTETGLSPFVAAALANGMRNSDIASKLQSQNVQVRQSGMLQAVAEYGQQLDTVRSTAAANTYRIARGIFADAIPVGSPIFGEIDSLPPLSKGDNPYGRLLSAVEAHRTAIASSTTDIATRRQLVQNLKDIQSNINSDAGPVTTVLEGVGDDSARLKLIDKTIADALESSGSVATQKLGTNGVAETLYTKFVLGASGTVGAFEDLEGMDGLNVGAAAKALSEVFPSVAAAGGRPTQIGRTRGVQLTEQARLRAYPNISPHAMQASAIRSSIIDEWTKKAGLDVVGSPSEKLSRLQNYRYLQIDTEGMSREAYNERLSGMISVETKKRMLEKHSDKVEPLQKAYNKALEDQELARRPAEQSVSDAEGDEFFNSMGL